jgi:hypothetical protein
MAYTLAEMPVRFAASEMDALDDALRTVRIKLRDESQRDTARGLMHMKREERRTLWRVASGAVTWAEVRSPHEDSVHRRWGLIALLCEGQGAGGGSGGDSVGSALRLLPPYATLVQGWVQPDGHLSAVWDHELSIVTLSVETVYDLNFIADFHTSFYNGDTDAQDAMKRRVSDAVLEYLAASRIGVPLPGGGFRPPTNAEEFESVPVFKALQDVLDSRGKGKLKPKKPRLVWMPANPETKAAFEVSMGWEMMLGIRHSAAHGGYHTVELWRSGITLAVIDGLVAAAVRVLTAETDGCCERHDKALRLRTARP